MQGTQLTDVSSTRTAVLVLLLLATAATTTVTVCCAAIYYCRRTATTALPLMNTGIFAKVLPQLLSRAPYIMRDGERLALRCAGSSESDLISPQLEAGKFQILKISPIKSRRVVFCCFLLIIVIHSRRIYARTRRLHHERHKLTCSTLAATQLEAQSSRCWRYDLLVLLLLLGSIAGGCSLFSWRVRWVLTGDDRPPQERDRGAVYAAARAADGDGSTAATARVWDGAPTPPPEESIYQ